MSSGPFACQRCTFLNPASAGERCQLCHHFRDEASRLRAAERSLQRQQRQLREREAQAAAAAAAAHALDSDGDSDSSDSSSSMHTRRSWSCPACTSFNPNSLHACSVCSTTRGGTTAPAPAPASALTFAPSKAASSGSSSRRARAPGALAAGLDPAAAASAAAPDSSPSATARRGRARSKGGKGSSPYARPSTGAGSLSPSAPTAGLVPPVPFTGMSFDGSSSARALLSALSVGGPLSRAGGGRGGGLMTAAVPAPAAPAPAKPAIPALTQEDSRPELSDTEAIPFYAQFTTAAQIYGKGKGKQAAPTPLTADEQQAVTAILHTLFNALGYKPLPVPPSSAAASASSSATSSADATPMRAAACQSCFTEWDDECQPLQMETCGHAHFCKDCATQVVAIKIREEQVMPWLGCPSAGCRHPLSVRDLTAVASAAELAHLAFVYMRKRLVRNECFVSCQTRDCGFGFLVQNTKAGKPPKPTQMTCVLCSSTQMVEKGKEGELDDAFQEMIRVGTLRPCPKCRHLTLKERGVCNVLQCIKCSVWWNWRTKETGKDSTTLKQKARMNGSLWEAGELDYQRRLEQTNPEEFRKLLERNGGKYVRAAGEARSTAPNARRRQ